MSDFVVDKSTPEAFKVWASEATLAFHTVKHHQSYRSLDCTSKLLTSIFKDSPTAKKISCSRTKAEAISTGVLSPPPPDLS